VMSECHVETIQAIIENKYWHNVKHLVKNL
jgi:hypothetical protein